MTSKEQPLSAVNPAAAASGAQALFDAAATEFPEPKLPESDLVTLPAGLEKGGKLITTVTVRELNGGDEEKIFRALLSRNPFHLRNTVIECGTVRIGDQDESHTLGLLRELLIGDLDAILFGIYKMTYGALIELKGWACPECGDKSDISFDVNEDIPVKTLADIAEIRFEVPLRKGGVAKVRLPTGDDQSAVGDNPDRTLVERNTVLLQRCIEEVLDSGGRSHSLVAFPGYARQMGIKDRRTILEQIAERQPGPQYTDIKFVHVSCAKEVTLALNLADLFLG